jgi:NAD(P)-dependent dehydrogenase (short-subunit alcohol dehydrogenase family)
MSAVDERFGGRRALVTGASRGIGAACARGLLAAGADVVLVGRDRAALEQVAATAPDRAHVLVADLASASDTDEVAGMIGDLDVLVNAAGVATMKRSTKLVAADLDAHITVNVRAVLVLATAAGRGMVERGSGSIVTVTSVAGLGAAPYQAAYAASKAASDALTRTLAIEWAPHGVRVNSVAPGIVRTGMSALAWNERDIERRTATNIPMGRLGTAEEIATVVLFLAGDGASYVTGQTIVVDGGLLGSYDLTTGRNTTS